MITLETGKMAAAYYKDLNYNYHVVLVMIRNTML